VTTDEQELFQYWLAHMDDALAEFAARLPPAVRAALDHSPPSLEVLERFLLERYPDIPAIKADPAPYLDGAARYVGEVFRRGIGGAWRLRDDDPSYVFAGLPEITFAVERDTPVCPITLVTTALDRRTGAVLSTVYRSAARRGAGQRSAGPAAGDGPTPRS
jgi:hypothetical protein